TGGWRSAAERYARDGRGRRSISCTTSAWVTFSRLWVATPSAASPVVAPAWGAAAWGAGAAAGFSPDGSFDDGEQAVTSAAADSRRTIRRVVIGEEASPAPTRPSILGRVREQSGATHEHEERAGGDPHRVHRDVVRRRRPARNEQLVELVERGKCDPEADRRRQQRGPPQSLFAECPRQQATQDRILEDVGALANERVQLEELVGRRTRQQRLQDRQEDAAGMLAGEPARREEGDDSGPRDDCEPGTEPRVGRRPR